jgi:ribosome-associated heat shock protein Hsp15
VESTRVDRWLWSIRLCSSRSEGTDICRSGHVTINGRPAKPSAKVVVGDRVEARVHSVNRIVEVTKVIDARVGAPIAVTCYLDHTPVPTLDDTLTVASRDRGAGRPTKRDRRQLDRWRGANR